MSTSNTAVEYDRTPPHDPLAEQCVLGGMLLSPSVIPDVLDRIKGRDFYKPIHATIFEAIVARYSVNDPTDAVSIAALLLGAGDLERVGGVPYLHTLASAVPTAANAPYYAGIVAERSAMRRLIEAGTRIVQIGYGNGPGAGHDAEQRIDLAHIAVHELTEAHARSNVSFAKDLVGPAMDAIDNASRGIKISGISTGYHDFDRLLDGGLHPGNLVIAAGRPGMGKSIFGVDVLRHAAITLGRPALMISLEMMKEELMQRVFSAESRVPLTLIKNGSLSEKDWTAVARAAATIAESPLAIDDTPGQTLTQIKAAARRHQQQHGLDLLVIDYLQLMATSGRFESRQLEVAHNVRGLKELAKELRIPVVALCQLNRGSEQRADKRPQLSDLRESGEIEQAADIVVLLHREDYYDPETPRAGEVDFIVAKNRQGAPDTITMVSQLHLSQFLSMAVG